MYSAGVDRTQEVELFHAHQSHSYCESTYMFLPGSKVPYGIVCCCSPRRDRPSRLRVCCDEEITQTCIYARRYHSFSDDNRGESRDGEQSPSSSPARLIKTLIPNVSHRSGLGGTGRSCMNDDAGIDANPGAYQSLVLPLLVNCTDISLNQLQKHSDTFYLFLQAKASST